MVYVDTDDVGAKLQHLTLSTTSDPTIAETEQFVDQVEAQVNARLNGVGIETPITDADKLNVIRPVVVNGVVAEVLRSIDMESEAAATYQKLFEDAIKAIERRPAIMDTATSYTAPGGSGRGTIRFTRDGQEW